MADQTTIVGTKLYGVYTAKQTDAHLLAKKASAGKEPDGPELHIGLGDRYRHYHACFDLLSIKNRYASHAWFGEPQ